MRTLLLVLLAAASSAAAQTPDSVAVPRSRSALRADLVIGGVAAGAATVVVARLVLGSVAKEQHDWAFALYPVGIAAGVHGLARQQDFEGSLGRSALGTAAGTLVGLAGGYALFYAAFEVSGGLFSSRNEAAGLALVFAGIGTVMTVPAVMAARTYRMPEATPVVLVGPDGARTAGLALRVAL